MSSHPWGPHGPEASPFEVKPNPTAPSGAVPDFGQPDYSTPAMTGGGGALGAVLANIVTSVVMMLLIWEAVVCLYPITAIAAITAWRVTAPAVNLVVPADLKGDFGYLMGFFAAVVAAGVVIRLEYRLAQNTGFRLARHVVRMVLLSIWAIPILMLCMGASYPKSTTLFIFSVVTSPPTMVQFLSNPIRLAIWAGSMVGLHFMIWDWKGARNMWHNRLKWVGLK
jgi:hypothetical protein